MKIVITKEDVDKYPYADVWNCPMAMKMKELLGKEDVVFFQKKVDEAYTGKPIGKVDPGFYARDYYQLKRGETKEFVTEYTPINN